MPAEAAAEVVQDAKAQPRHVPLCPICLEDLRVMTLWICSLVGAHPGPHWSDTCGPGHGGDYVEMLSSISRGVHRRVAEPP